MRSTIVDRQTGDRLTKLLVGFKDEPPVEAGTSENFELQNHGHKKVFNSLHFNKNSDDQNSISSSYQADLQSEMI